MTKTFVTKYLRTLEETAHGHLDEKKIVRSQQNQQREESNPPQPMRPPTTSMMPFSKHVTRKESIPQ